MAASLKQRLTGAAVLLLSAAILWPLVFDDPYSSQVDTRTEIPPEPALQEGFALEEPRPVHDGLTLETGEFSPSEASPLDGIAPLELAEPVVTSEPAKAADKPTPKPAAMPKPAAKTSPASGMGTDARGLPERWSVQLASFRDEASALALKNKLVAKGYPAYVKPADIKGSRFVRVYVGPKLDRAAAEALQQTINREFKLKSIVVRFDP